MAVKGDNKAAYGAFAGRTGNGRCGVGGAGKGALGEYGMAERIAALGEFDLIERIAALGGSLPAGVVGIGDDCAVIPSKAGHDTLVSADMLIEDVHFRRDLTSAYDLGWKSAAVNVSDIAAMGGRPEATFLSFALPASLGDRWRLDFMKGYMELCSRYGVSLLGGDTTSSPDRLCINVTVMGTCPHGRAVRRNGAKVGDVICVTGTLGDSAAGLRLLLGFDSSSAAAAASSTPSAASSPSASSSASAPSAASTASVAASASSAPVAASAGLDVVAPSLACAAAPGLVSPEDSSAGLSAAADPTDSDLDFLIRCHRLPVPMVEAGLELASLAGVHAMMDISDGVASDLRHILHASGVGAQVYLDRLPFSASLERVCLARSWDKYELALCGGEDYHLLFTADPATPLEKLRHACHIIGKITADPDSLEWIGGDGKSADYIGFRHF